MTEQQGLVNMLLYEILSIVAESAYFTHLLCAVILTWLTLNCCCSVIYEDIMCLVSNLHASTALFTRFPILSSSLTLQNDDKTGGKSSRRRSKQFGVTALLVSETIICTLASFLFSFLCVFDVCLQPLKSRSVCGYFKGKITMLHFSFAMLLPRSEILTLQRDKLIFFFFSQL